MHPAMTYELAKAQAADRRHCNPRRATAGGDGCPGRAELVLATLACLAPAGRSGEPHHMPAGRDLARPARTAHRSRLVTRRQR
jgi:hypothetical protein